MMPAEQVRYFVRLRSKYTGKSLWLGAVHPTKAAADAYIATNVCLRCNYVRLIYDVMPLAVNVCVDRYPGRSLIVRPDHTYQITTAEHAIKRDALARSRAIHTKAMRFADSVEALRDSEQLDSLVIVNIADQIRIMFASRMWDHLQVPADLDSHGVA